MTNNHVITARDGDPADEILVELNDGRELSAQLVGRDPRSDLAVLKVDAVDLPFLPVADSDQLEVGDVVFAIGNPMGVGLTITRVSFRLPDGIICRFLESRGLKALFRQMRRLTPAIRAVL